MRIRLFLPLAAASAFLLPGTVAAAPTPAAPYRSILPRLTQARVPVYLPSWLPNFGRPVYPVLSFLHKKKAYEVDLSYVKHTVGYATEAMYMTGNLDTLSPGPKAKKVSLGHGVTGYVGSIPGTANDSLTVRWKVRGVVYVLGHAAEKDLIHAARSVVRVHG